MGPLLAAAIPAVASLIGGVFANRANAKQARKAEQFSAHESDTAVQRRVEDLKKAGLNPGLAYQQQASTPTGMMGRQEDVLTPAVNAASSGLRQRQEMQIARDTAETNIQLMKQQAGAAGAANRSQTAQAELLNEQLNQARLMTAQLQLTNPITLARAAADLDNTQTNTLLAKLQIPGLTNAAGFSRIMGKWEPGLKFGTGLIGDVTNIGKGTAGIFEAIKRGTQTKAAPNFILLPKRP